MICWIFTSLTRFASHFNLRLLLTASSRILNAKTMMCPSSILDQGTALRASMTWPHQVLGKGTNLTITFRWRIIRTAASVLIWRKTKRARSILLVALCLPLCQVRSSSAGLPRWMNWVIGLRLKRSQKTQKVSYRLIYFFLKRMAYFSLYLSGDRHDLFSFVNLHLSNIGISFFFLIVCSGLFIC